jgi:hypothetical protein
MSDLKLAIATAAGAVASEMLPVPQPEILGAPLGMLLAAHAGALFALARTPPDKWGKLLEVDAGIVGSARIYALLRRSVGILFTVTATAFAAAWTAAWVPHIFTSLKTAPLAAGAGLLAYIWQALLPRAFKALGNRLDAWGGVKP